MASTSELLQEADVVVEHVAEVVDAVALHRHAVDAEAEGEAAPLLGVDARRHAARSGWTMPQPPSSSHVAVGALDVELGRRLGEREVATAQPRR